MTPNWPLQNLGLTHSIIDGYLENRLTKDHYYTNQPTLEGIEKAIDTKKAQFTQEQRSLLVEVLHEQLDAIKDDQLNLTNSRKNIDSLLSDHTFTITTGQQLHLFLGPGYFINKIFTCIKLCLKFNEIKKDTNVVPVFWLASEDHDIDEISSVELYGESFKTQLVEGKITGAQETNNLRSFIQEIENRLGAEAKNAKFFQICKTAYLNQPNLSKATAYIIYALFAEYGIVVIDANNAQLKNQFKHVFREELEQQFTSNLQKEVKNRFDAEKHHYQVMPRGTNLFEIDQAFMRSKAITTTFNPNKTYSPNALLRPLYQEYVLPNVAYVGGMAEVNYWLQLKPVFDHYELAMPVIWQRDTIHLAKAKKIKQLLNQPWSVEDIARFDESSFEQGFIKEKMPTDLLRQLDQVDQTIKDINTDLDSEDWKKIKDEYTTLQIQIKKEFRGLKKELLQGKRYKTTLETAKKLYNIYFNKQKLQERTVSCLSLAMNLNQFQRISDEYLTCSMQHGYYYLIED